MKSSVYPVNKGVNAPLSFKGLKGQYITCMVITLLSLFLLFVLLYLIGLNRWICLAFIFGLGTLLIWLIYHLNHKYRVNGLVKKRAFSMHPECVIIRSYKTISTNLKSNEYKP